MRQIATDSITHAIEALFLKACIDLPKDVRCGLCHARENETLPRAKQTLELLEQNADIASARRMPLCQDTGMAVIFAELGQDAHITGGDFTAAVNEGVRRAYKKGYFRNSVLSPLERKNTGDNTPAIIHLSLVPGDKLTLTALPKGFGSENMSRLGMLTPAQGAAGMLDFVVETVRLAGANPCPPIVVGVGVGGTAEWAMRMAKHALARELGAPAQEAEAAAYERTLLERINALGIGPQGLGGDTTALAVHMELFPTHLAGLPVAVNIQCHMMRHAVAVL